MNVSLFPTHLTNASSPLATLEGERSRRSEADIHAVISSKPPAALIPLAIVSENKFFRTCLARCLGQMAEDFDVSTFDNAVQWAGEDHSTTSGIVLLCGDGQKLTEALVQNGLDLVMQTAHAVRVIIISDFEHPALMIDALNKGAKGFITTNLDLDIVLGAIKLVNVGGTFIPASGLMSTRSNTASASHANSLVVAKKLFTGRQLEVLEHLRVGDPNKIIAHKMSMSEATVKIHVRNMMRKIKARNRTELVCKSEEFLNQR